MAQGAVITIGNGNQQAPRPIDLGWRYSLYETLYYESEIDMFGLLCGVTFSGNFMSDFSQVPMQVFIGSTNLTSLQDVWIPASQLTQVFSGTVDIVGGHSPLYISFNNPYAYTSGNLVLMVYMPQNLYLSQSQMFDCQTVGTNRARFVHSDTEDFNPATPPAPTAGQLSGLFPKTAFYAGYYPVMNDLSVQELSGNTTPVQGMSTVYLVYVGNTGVNSQSQYTVKLFKADHTELASVTGVPLSTGQYQYLILSWAPTVIENTSIYAKVFLDDDQNTANNQTNPINIAVQPLGAIIEPPIPTITDRVPVDMYYENSLFETIYTSNSYGFMSSPYPHFITGLTFFNYFSSNLLNMPTRIWMGDTPLNNLADGWIPSTELNLVFDGTVNYPMGQNNIIINFQTPYLHRSDNLVMLVQRPLDSNYYSYTDKFYCYEAATQCSRKLYLDAVIIDPANPMPEGVLNNIYPKTTFYYSVAGLGAVNGFVRNSSGVSLNNATVEIAEAGLTATTYNYGLYNFPAVMMGTYQITASKTGYYPQTQTANINSTNALTMSFDLQPITNTTISGRVLNSNNPTEPVSAAVITLSGSVNSVCNTGADGYFTFNQIPVNQPYTITVTHNGFIDYTQTFTVGYDTVNLEDILLVPVSDNPDTPEAYLATAFVSAYPNPFRDNTVISYKLHRPAMVSIEIFNIKGQKVCTIVDEQKQKGSHSINWNTKNYNNTTVCRGLYFCRMTVDNYVSTKKIVLIK